MSKQNKGIDMYKNEEENQTIYNVVINHEEQYSIWPVSREIPSGWKVVGNSGLKQDCLVYIGKVWTDMRPLSLRKKMKEEAWKQKTESVTTSICPDLFSNI